MLVIRLQRTGRKGHAMFRIIVQDSRRSPTSGKVVAFLGSYDPHGKTVILDKEKASTFINNGAQPSDRVISLLKSESVKLPKWAIPSPTKSKDVKNPDKRRSTAPEPAEKPTEEAAPAEATALEPEQTEVEQPKEEAVETTENSEEATTTTEPEEQPEANEAPEEAKAEEESPVEKPEQTSDSDTPTETEE